jgi:peroxiredoxin
VNDPFTNKAFAEANGLQFPILSDYARETIRMYGVFHENFAGLTGYAVAKRSVFIQDKNGTLCYKWISEDPSKEPNYQEVIGQLGELLVM